MRAAHLFFTTAMTIFSLNYKLHREEDRAAINSLMEAWEGRQVAESTWILKRNDGCTCQTILDDLLEHISAENEIYIDEHSPSILT